MIYFEIIALIFFGTSLLIISFILYFLHKKKRLRNQYKKWKNMADLLVRSAIFNEENSLSAQKTISITKRTESLLIKPKFRKLLTKEILSAKKNISGTASTNLINLYLQLGLDVYASKNMDSNYWHLKAKAIQDLGIMEQKKYLPKIYRQTNNVHELVRMEAQLAIIKISGFEGLRFLDVISYQLTDWQQIKLLNELSQSPPEHFNGVEKWLQSTNESVVIFALKLAKNYHRFELYPQITTCLTHQSLKIRHQAILAMEKIYMADTSKLLLEKFADEEPKNQATIIKVVQQIGDAADADLLLSYLNTDNNEMKRIIVRALAHISDCGLDQLKKLTLAQQYPLDQIIKQIEGELIA